VFIVAVQPIHHRLRAPTRAFSHSGGTGTLHDIMQGKPSLAGAGMRGTQSQLAHVDQRLAPASMINTQHQS
jgi:hypothetical protein